MITKMPSFPACCKSLTIEFSAERLAYGRRDAAILPLMVFLIPMLLIVCGMAINWAHIQLAKTELQVATDAAVRAAGRVYLTSGDFEQSMQKAQQVADKNLVDNQPLMLQSNDFSFGISSRNSINDRYSFSSAQTSQTNSMRLEIEKSSNSPSGPVRLVFPIFNNISQVNIKSQATVSQTELDIALVIDRSGSMAYSVDEVASPFLYPASAPLGWEFGDPAPPLARWRDTAAAVNVFLQHLQQSPQSERVSLVTYGDQAQLEVDLTSNYQFINQGIDFYTNSLPLGATNIGDGLIVGNNSLKNSVQARPFASKVIILMTDGIHNFGTDPIWAANQIASQGVMIFTITFSNEANIGAMQQIATIGKGKHYHANSSAALQAAFNEIARSLPSILTQ